MLFTYYNEKHFRFPKCRRTVTLPDGDLSIEPIDNNNASEISWLERFSNTGHELHATAFCNIEKGLKNEVTT